MTEASEPLSKTVESLKAANEQISVLTAAVYLCLRKGLRSFLLSFLFLLHAILLLLAM